MSGLDYPGVGPEHAFLKDSGRAEYVAVTDDQALEVSQPASQAYHLLPSDLSVYGLWWWCCCCRASS